MPTTNYLWDPIHDCVMMETDENGNVAAQYIYEPVPNGRLISEHRNGVEYNHHYDGQGNTIALTDESGNVTDTLVYSVFGEVVARTGTTNSSYQFGGEYGYQTDSATGDIYVRQRIYEPKNQRWLSTDPVPDELARSAYLYVLNNPVNRNDPSGLDAAGMEPINPEDGCGMQKVRECTTDYEKPKGGKCNPGYTLVIQQTKEDGVITYDGKLCLKDCDTLASCPPKTFCQIYNSTLKIGRKETTTGVCRCTKKK